MSGHAQAAHGARTVQQEVAVAANPGVVLLLLAKLVGAEDHAEGIVDALVGFQRRGVSRDSGAFTHVLLPLSTTVAVGPRGHGSQ